MLPCAHTPSLFLKCTTSKLSTVVPLCGIIACSGAPSNVAPSCGFQSLHPPLEEIGQWWWLWWSSHHYHCCRWQQCIGDMCSIIWGTGWSTLVRAGHYNTCLCYIKRVSQSASQPCTTRLTPRLREFSQRFKSSAALLKTVGHEGAVGGPTDSNGEKTQATGDGTLDRKPIKVCNVPCTFFACLHDFLSV